MSEKNNKIETPKTSSDLLKKTTTFVSHPLFGLFTFIAGLIFTLIFFYSVELIEVKPVYSVNVINSIASQTLDEPDFKIFWKEEEIKNLNSVEVAIWNNGKQFLDKDNISDSDPIKIIIPDGVKVLKVDIVKTSRPELSFNCTYFPSKDNIKNVIIDIVGDEALEKSDGLMIKIYFTGSSEEEFIVTGRIFGSKQGFTKVHWGENKILNFFELIAQALVLFFFVIFLFRFVVLPQYSIGWKILFTVFYSIIIILVGASLIFSLPTYSLPVWVFS